MTLREQMTADVAAIFLNEDDFAEEVTYIPYRFPGQAARAERTISAVVSREVMSTMPGDAETVGPVFEVSVANSSTTGIASTEIDTGRDRIRLPSRDGKDAVEKAIHHIVMQDHAMLVLELR